MQIQGNSPSKISSFSRTAVLISFLFFFFFFSFFGGDLNNNIPSTAQGWITHKKFFFASSKSNHSNHLIARQKQKSQFWTQHSQQQTQPGPKKIKKSILILTFHLQQLTKISFSWEEPQRIFTVCTQPGQEKEIKFRNTSLIHCYITQYTHVLETTHIQWACNTETCMNWLWQQAGQLILFRWANMATWASQN